MARYLGPKLKLSRREGTDLYLKVGYVRLTPNAKSITHRVNMASVVAACLITRYSCVKSKKCAAFMVY